MYLPQVKFNTFKSLNYKGINYINLHFVRNADLIEHHGLF